MMDEPQTDVTAPRREAPKRIQWPTSGQHDEAAYRSLGKPVTDALDEILYAEHMGDVMRGFKRLAVALRLPEPVRDESLWGGYEWPWLVAGNTDQSATDSAGQVPTGEAGEQRG